MQPLKRGVLQRRREADCLRGPECLPPLPPMLVSDRRPLCCPEVPSAAPAPHTAAASGSPAPAPCVEHWKTRTASFKSQSKHWPTIKKKTKKKTPHPSAIYSRHTVPSPQAHAVSHSVAQGDQRQFSDWPVTVVSLYFRSSNLGPSSWC